VSLAGVIAFAAFGDTLVGLVQSWSENNAAEAGGGLGGRLRTAPAPVRLVLGPLALLLMPFPPWEVLLASRRAPAYFFAASSLVLYAVFPCFLFGLRAAISGEWVRRLPVVLFLGAIAVGVALVYAGTVPRFRTQLVPFALVLTAAGVFRTERGGWIAAAYFLGLGAVVAVYYLVVG